MLCASGAVPWPTGCSSALGPPVLPLSPGLAISGFVLDAAGPAVPPLPQLEGKPAPPLPDEGVHLLQGQAAGVNRTRRLW